PLRLLYSPRTRAVEPRTSGSARRARISSRVRRSSVPVAIPVLVLPPPAVAAAVVTAGPPPGGCRSARRGATAVPSDVLTSRRWGRGGSGGGEGGGLEGLVAGGDRQPQPGHLHDVERTASSHRPAHSRPFRADPTGSQSSHPL